MRTTIAVLALMVGTALADDNDHRHEKEEQHNYILERQQAYLVEGVPTQRLIIGKREIDIYQNGQMFEGNHMVGSRMPW